MQMIQNGVFNEASDRTGVVSDKVQALLNEWHDMLTIVGEELKL